MRTGLTVTMVLLALVAAGCGSAGRGPAPAPAAEWPGRLHRLEVSLPSAPALAINVPEDYEAGHRRGDGFDVHLLRRPPQAASPESATLGIYIGHHPRPIRDKALAETDTVAGREVTWYGSTWQEDGRTVYQAETQVQGLFAAPGVWGLGVRDQVVHLFAWGTDQAQVEVLIRACRSLRLEGGR